MTRHYRCFFKDGRNGGIRTRDLLVPNQAHYQAVLRPVRFQAPDKYSTFSEKIKERHLICGT